MLAVSMPNLATSAAFVETATKCLATAFSSPPSPVERPVARGLGVGHRLQRRECLRRDDEERLRRIEILDASAKSVPSTLETKRNVMLRSL